jgi:hypothetical protein
MEEEQPSVRGNNKKMEEIPVPKGASREYFYSIYL